MTQDIMLRFNFKLISKDNEKIQNKQKKYFLSKKYKNFEKLIKDCAYIQLRNKKMEPFEKDARLNMKIFVYYKTKVHSDMFNLPKSLADALQNVIYPNDRQIKSGSICLQEDADRDYFTVFIKQME